MCDVAVAILDGYDNAVYWLGRVQCADYLHKKILKKLLPEASPLLYEKYYHEMHDDTWKLLKTLHAAHMQAGIREAGFYWINSEEPVTIPERQRVIELRGP